MHPVLKTIIGLLILLIAVFITLGVLFSDLTQRSFYEETGTVKVEGITDTVNVIRNNFGVAHIYARNERDMYFAQGYTHAQDRLWQMDIMRRVAEGRLSEIYGRDVLDYDVLFRTIGIGKSAYSFYNQLSPKTKSILDSYTKGVNYFIQTHIKNLPLEFDVLNYKPDEWKPEHSLMIVRLMGWDLNLSWYADYMFGEVVNKLGLERAKELFPIYPETGPFVIHTNKETEKKDSVKTKNEKKDVTLNLFQGQRDGNSFTQYPPLVLPPDKSGRSASKGGNNISYNVIENNYKSLAVEGADFFNTVKNYRNYFGIEGSHIGSNAWVVNGKKTENGKPILANDPHLSLSVPSKWYEIHLYNDQYKSSVAGYSLPGTPAVVIGSNNVISWGMTSLMSDDSDFYILQLDSSNRTKYKIKDATYPLDSLVESIKVKGENDSYDFTCYTTRLGPVISNLNVSGFGRKRELRTSPDKIIVLRWTGFDFSDELEAIYKVNYAKSWTEFRNGLSLFGVPPSNFVYADTSGNIGYQVAGKISLRNNVTGADNGYIPTYTSMGTVDFTGYVHFDELPNEYNPQKDYIVTANNPPLKDYKYYISDLFEPPYRAMRIDEILKSRGSFSADEFKLIQTDFMNLLAKQYCEYLFEAFRDSVGIPMDYRKYYELLKKWDYQMTAFSPAATIFAAFEIQLYKNLYMNLLGKDVYDNYVFIQNVPVRNTVKLLTKNNSWLFSDGQNETTNRNFILRKSFIDGIDELKEISGTDDYNNWLWGNYHKILMQHPLGQVPALGGILNIGPYEMGGSGVTVNNAEYNFSKPLESGNFNFTLGASMRMIVDLSKNKNLLTIITTGQSGQPLHPNYRDQSRLWLNGEYTSITIDFNELLKEELKVLKLEP
ncbi:MAG TPA: penicillin acylase family protein [Ignavibacteria bacterium]|nr:penicillin acylase family protein [Ignavibacteria bacterium]